MINDPSEFRWQGGVYMGAFAGQHYFQFLPSKKVQGGCTFVHGEDYSGWLTFLFGDGRFGLLNTMTRNMYGGFGNDIKARMEALKSVKV